MNMLMNNLWAPQQVDGQQAPIIQGTGTMLIKLNPINGRCDSFGAVGIHLYQIVGACRGLLNEILGTLFMDTQVRVVCGDEKMLVNGLYDLGIDFQHFDFCLREIMLAKTSECDRPKSELGHIMRGLLNEILGTLFMDTQVRVVCGDEKMLVNGLYDLGIDFQHFDFCLREIMLAKTSECARPKSELGDFMGGLIE